MAVGYPLSKGALDNRIGHLIIATDNILSDWARLYDLITSDEGNDAALTALGYNSQDIALIKAVVFAMNDLNEVSRGRKSLPSSNNFFFYAKKVRGVE